MKILIPGASGLLGINLAVEAARNHEIIGTYHSNKLHHTPFKTISCDLSNPQTVENLILTERPDLVINCAALANVDACENQKETAEQLNTKLPAQLANLSRAENIRFIHISTDAVFDGQKERFSEEDIPNPINYYARTKLEGEIAVQQANPDAIIARINIFGWSLKGKRSLAEWFFNNLSAGNAINGFTDVTFCPLFVGDLADILLQMVDKNLHGLYHVVGGDCLNKFDFGREIAHKFGFDPSLISPKSWKDGALTAVRSSNLCLDIRKLLTDLNIPAPRFETGLESFYRQFVDDFPKKLKGYSDSK